jgi:SUMO ligase MMS21 Smc5/6 complex component
MIAEEKANRYEKELRNFQESVAIQLSSGARMVDATAIGIRERIKDIQLDLKEKQFVGGFQLLAEYSIKSLSIT